MQILPIRTERDHECGVAGIGELMSARPGTPKEDELDVLATLVDVYEAMNRGIERNYPP